MSLNPLSAGRELFRLPDYGRLWVAGALSGITRWLEFIAIGIFAYELTHSPPLVALLAVIRMAPYVLLGFFVGALADRFDRRMLMMLATCLLALTTLVMAALTATGHATYTTVAVVTFISGIFWTIDMPVRRRLIADAAGPGNLAAALGFDNATTYATRALGPLIGGTIYQVLGIAGIYGLIAIAYLICLEMAVGLGRQPRSAASADQKDGLLASLSFPLALLLNRRFAIIMGVTLVHNVCSFPFLTMVPVISQKDFHLEPYLVGAMSSLEGLGGTIGAIFVGVLATERTLFRFYYFGSASMLALMLAMSFYLVVPVAVPALLMMGAAAAAFSATQYALVHVSAPPELRGRATGILSVFIGSSMAGHYLAGQLFGTFTSALATRTMALGGLVTLAILGTLWMTTRDAQRSSAPTAS